MVKLSFYRVIALEDKYEGHSLQEASFMAYILSFFRETTMAGFPMLIRQPGIIKKLYWLFGIGLMSYLLYWECDLLFKKFTKFQAATSVNIQTSRRLYFPAITICNNNPVTLDWYDPDLYDEAKGFSGGGAGGGGGGGGGDGASSRRRRDASFLPRHKRGIGNGDEEIRRFREEEEEDEEDIEILDFSGEMEEKLTIQEKAARIKYDKRSVVGHQLCDMILECQFGGVSCDPSSAFDRWHYNAEFGNCYTFNAGHLEEESSYRRESNDMWKLKTGKDDDGVRVSTQTGDPYGLYLLLNADTDHYLVSTTQVGWRIAMHNSSEMPFPEETGIFVEPGTSTRIGISLSYIKQLGVVSNPLYTAKYSDCVNRPDFVKDDYNNAYSKLMEVAYTASACYKTCYQRAVMTKCQCFDFLYPSHGSAFPSDSLPPCAYKNKTLWLCRERVRNRFQQGKLNCRSDCPETCESYSFSSVISSMRWPNPTSFTLAGVCKKIYEIMSKRVDGTDMTCNGSSNIAKMVKRGAEYKLLHDLQGCSTGNFEKPIESYYELADYIIGNQFAEVYIYYKDFNYQTIIASEFLDLADLMAYIGGIFGLFFGLTFMTLLEYFQLIFDLIAMLIAKLVCRGKNNKVEETKAPALYGGRRVANPVMNTQKVQLPVANTYGNMASSAENYGNAPPQSAYDHDYGAYSASHTRSYAQPQLQPNAWNQ